jgi:hypothetical protein
VEMLDAIEGLDLVDHVAPVQLAIRLLIPNGSRLLELPEVRARIGGFDPGQLAYTWTHEDPQVDALQRAVMLLVGSQAGASRAAAFDAVRGLVHQCAGMGSASFPPQPPRVDRAAIPYLDEPWYC